MRWAVLHYLAFAAVTALVLSPTLGPVQKDDFPLSPFAMFADDKDAKTTITQAIGLRADASEQILGPATLGTDEVLQAKETLGRVPRSPKKAQQDFCREFAAKIAKDDAFASLTRIEVRTVTYETLAYFADPAAPPIKKTVHVRCGVTRP
jgi:hypothetical protein